MNTKEFNLCLRMIARGDNRGREQFYTCFYEKIKWSAVADGMNKEDAGDVASRVLLDIFHNAASYGYVRKPKAWIYKVKRNAIINHKKQNAKYVYTELIDEVFSAKDMKPEFKMDFCNFIDTLPPRQQEVIKLRYMYGFKITEAARFLKASVSTVNRDIAAVKDEVFKFYMNL